MSNTLRNLIIRVGVDLTEAQKGLKQATKELKSTGKALTSVGSTLTKGLTVPILGAAVASVKFASDMEESTNKVNVAFGDSAKTVKDWSTGTLKSFGLAKGSALDMASTFGDMGTAMGQSSTNAADMSMSLVGLAADMASFKNISIEQASTALRGIYTGEGEALKTLGVIMQDSTLIAYAQANGYKKSYKEMTQAEKVALRYAYVMEATKNAQGDFARTSDGVANQTRLVSESLKESAASLGEGLLPYVAEALKSVNKLVGQFSKLSDSQKNTIIKIGLVVASIGPLLTGLGKMSTGLSTVTGWIGKATKATSGAGGLGKSLASLAGSAGPIALVVIALAGLTAAYFAATEDQRKYAREVKDFTDSIKATNDAHKETIDQINAESDAAATLTDELFDLADKESLSNEEKIRMKSLVTQLNGLIPDLSLSIDDQTGSLNKNREAVTDLIKEHKKELLFAAYQETLTDAYKARAELTAKLATEEERLANATADLENMPKIGIIAILKGISPGKLDAAHKSASDAINVYSAALKENEKIIKQYEGSYDELAGAMETDNNNIADSSGETTAIIAADFAEQKAQVEDFMKDVEDRTKEHFDTMGDINDYGIQQNKISAAKVQQNLLKQIEDFRNWRTGIKELAAKVPTDVMAELTALGPEYSTLIADLNQMTGTELNAWVATWRAKASEAEYAALEELSGLPGAATEIGRAFGQGLINGIASQNRGIQSAGRTAANTALESMSSVLQTHSPSKVTERIGSYTGTGFVNGLMGKIRDIREASRDMGLASIGGLGALSRASMSMPGIASSGFSEAAYNQTAQTADRGTYTLNVNGASNPEQVAGIVVQRLKMAGVVG